MKNCFFLALSLFIATLVSAQMSGTYTINSNSSTNPDYTSFSAAASALSAGVTGQVIFEVAPGTYEEYVTINQINGASANNRVIFRGMGTSNQQVVITSNAGYTDNATIKLNGTDYITFENMTVTTTSTGSEAQTLRFNGQCDYTRFENVRFVGVDVSSPSSNDNGKNLVHMYNGDDIVDHDTQFVGCQFINGSIALYLQGKNMNLFNENVLVEGCHFENQSFKSIYITFHNNVVLRGNTIVNANDYKNDYNAIDIFQCYQGGLIENNVINVTRASAYTTVFKIRPLVGTADNHVIIRNNIIDLNCNSNSYSYAFSIDYNDSNYIDFAHNTIKCSGTGQNGNIYIQKNGQNFNLYNNLLVNESTGYVFRFLTTVDSRICDYNRIAFSGNNIGRIGTTDYATLSDWTTGTGFDAHSALCTPNFVSANDLHLASAEGITVANPLSYVTKDIDDQDRSTTEPCAGADEYSSVIPVTVGTATFDDLTLNASGIWEGEEEENYMLSGGWYFTNYNYPEWSFWTGFTASNRTDLTPTGLSAQFTAAAGEGLNGSDQYGVAYVMGYGYLTDVFSADGQEHTVTGCYVTNNLWAYQNMLDGDATATPFGGTTGNDPDWFKLTAIGKNLEDEVVGTAEFYLADYRFENNDEDYILNTWEWFDLSSLGEVFTISFELSSTKNNTYGMVTPAYFCIEDFNGEAPLPPTPQDQPPYIANPVEDVVFNEYPETIEVNLDGVVTDDDDPDEDIVYSIVSNSNEEDLTATLNGKVLTLTRNHREAATATIVIRATSNGLYVDFNIHVIINEVPDGIEENEMAMISVYPNPAHDYIHVETCHGASVQIFNMIGQCVLSSTETEINVSTLPKGVYFVTVFTENQKIVERIIIE